MNRIEDAFKRVEERGEGALIGFITAGDPHPRYTKSFAEALIEGGVDILELGLPFSDPIADGPTIQAATFRALEAGTTPRTVFDIVDQIRRSSECPIAILTYYNPIYRIGVDRFVEDAYSYGVDGLIVPDLPVEEASTLKELTSKHNMSLILLATPSTSISRLDKIIEYASGFLYLVSIYGVTGARDALQERTLELVKRFSDHISGRIPLAVGFGISKPEHIKRIIEYGADGAIVGSAFVKLIESSKENGDEAAERLRSYAQILKKATRRFR